MDIEGHAPCLRVTRESLNLFLSLTIQFPAFLFALSTPLWLPESWRGIEIEIEKEREKEKKKKEKRERERDSLRRRSDVMEDRSTIFM